MTRHYTRREFVRQGREGGCRDSGQQWRRPPWNGWRARAPPRTGSESAVCLSFEQGFLPVQKLQSQTYDSCHGQVHLVSLASSAWARLKRPRALGDCDGDKATTNSCYLVRTSVLLSCSLFHSFHLSYVKYMDLYKFVLAFKYEFCASLQDAPVSPKQRRTTTYARASRQGAPTTGALHTSRADTCYLLSNGARLTRHLVLRARTLPAPRGSRDAPVLARPVQGL